MKTVIWAAGSLAAPLSELGSLLPARLMPEFRFGPSGTLKADIMAGAKPDIFLSASPRHVSDLIAAGLATEPFSLCRNAMALLLGPALAHETDPVDLLQRSRLIIGTSCPGADPSGDYAMEVIGNLEARLGIGLADLHRRLSILAGTAKAPQAPAGHNHYAWVTGLGLCDLFLTYRSNALQAVRQDPRLNWITLPEDIDVLSEFQGCLLSPSSVRTADSLELLRGREFSQILRSMGFLNM